MEDSAYDLLKGYLDSLKRHFADEQGRDEIVGDIESRIAEIFQEILKKGAHCITDEDVNKVIASMGRPEEIDDRPGSAEKEEPAGAGADFRSFIKPRKRLYRDPDDKILGGVCSGLGAYFGIDPVIFRLIFALLIFGAGTGILVYIILWIATPEARSSSEKLEMRGVRVDVHNISNAVKEEMGHIKDKMENFGNDIRNFSTGRGKEVGNDLGNVFRRFFNFLAEVIVILAKGILYIIAILVLIALVGGLVALAVSSAALFPLKELLLGGFWVNFLFWPAVILVIGVPVLALILFLVRKLVGIRQPNKVLNIGLSMLWVLGIILVFVMGTMVFNDFSTSYRRTDPFSLIQPSGRILILMRARNPVTVTAWSFGDGLSYTEDTAYIRRVDLRVEQSPDDSFRVNVTRISRGRNWEMASFLAREIQPEIYQNDSVLYISNTFALPTHSPFRNQHIEVHILVPLNGEIRIQPGHFNSLYLDNQGYWSSWNDGDENQPYEYRMTQDGLRRLDDTSTLKPALPDTSGSGVNKSTRGHGTYRYPGNIPAAPRKQSASGNPTSTMSDALGYLVNSLFHLGN